MSLRRVEESQVQLYARRLEVISDVESRRVVLADPLHERDVEGEQGVVASFDASKFRGVGARQRRELPVCGSPASAELARDHDRVTPVRERLARGIVVNASGAQSKQQDVIIADSAIVPPLIAGGGLTVQPVEAVVGTLEVKSSATAETVRDGVAKA